MRKRQTATLAAILLMAACQIPGAPLWNVDVFFPLKYPDVQLSQYLTATGGVMPATNVPFTTPPDSDEVSDATRQVFDQDIDTLRADVIFSNQTNVAGNLEISIASSIGNLFSANPAQAVTVNINPLHITALAGDTMHVLINTTLFKNAQKLYTRSRGTMRSGTGVPFAVTANDKFKISVELTASVKFSKKDGN